MDIHSHSLLLAHQPKSAHVDFPVFNVADCYVVIACIWFACLILFYYKDESDFDFLKASKRKGNK